jgi:hypothetical protein
MNAINYNLEDDQAARTGRRKDLGCFERSWRAFARISRHRQVGMNRLQVCFVAFLGIGLFTLVPPALAHGNGGGGHGNGGGHEHRRSFNPFWNPSIFYRTGIYDSAYCYIASPQQQTTAKQQVETYLLGVKKHRKPAATHRYISVETLRPTKEQLVDFSSKQQAAHRLGPAQLHCLMVFDTQTKEFVGSGCYIVTSEPLTGEVARFESVSAEFVGHGTF